MGQQIYDVGDSTNHWTCPSGVTSVDITLIGGGADGTNDGGGGGGFLTATISVSPGSSYKVIVGDHGSNGQDTSWEDTIYVAQGGQGRSGGGISGSGTGTTDSCNGGNGGISCSIDCTSCNSCDCTSFDQTCDNPPDCTSYSSNGNCNGYNCSSPGDPHSCSGSGGGGSSGTISGSVDGSWASCGNTGTDSCGYCYDVSCSDGTGGVAPNSPGGSGGNPNNPGTGYGGGGGANAVGTSGFAQLDWDDPTGPYTYDDTAQGGVIVNSTAPNTCRFNVIASGGTVGDSHAPLNYPVSTSGGVVVAGVAVVDQISHTAITKTNLEHYWDFSTYRTGGPSSTGCEDLVAGNDLGYFGGGSTVTGILGNGFSSSVGQGTFVWTIDPGSGGSKGVGSVDNRDYTFSVWIKPGSFAASFTVHTLFSLGGGNSLAANNLSGAGEAVIYYDHTANCFKFQTTGTTATGTNHTTATSSVTPSSGNWYHLIAWVDKTNSQVGISVNGTENTASFTSGTLGIWNIHNYSTAQVTTSGVGVPFQFEIGFSGDGLLPSSTIYDDAAWWSRLLSSSERLSLYNSGSGKALSDFVAAANSWQEFGHGGMVGAGQAARNSDVVATGGDVVNSTSTPNGTYNIGTSGGCLCNSSAIVSVTRAIYTASGGCLADSSAPLLLTHNVYPSGGTLANSTGIVQATLFPSSSGGVVADGSDVDTFVAAAGHIFEVGSGGIVANSTGVIQATHNVRTRGGVGCWGTADVSVENIDTSTGAVVSGVSLVTAQYNSATWSSAITFNDSLTGQVVLPVTDLSNTITFTDAINPNLRSSDIGNGGVKAGGQASSVGNRTNLTTSGGALAGGTSVVGVLRSAILTSTYTFTDAVVPMVVAGYPVTGGAVLDSTAKTSSLVNDRGIGGAILAGTALVNRRHNPAVSSAGLKANSTAKLSQRLAGVLSSTITFTDSLTFHARYGINGSGGLLGASSGIVGVNRRVITATGGGVAAGNAAINRRQNPTAAGGTKAAGTAVVGVVVNPGALANTITFTDAITPRLIAKPVIGGGTILNSTGIVHSRINVAAAGGVKLNSTAINTAIYQSGTWSSVITFIDDVEPFIPIQVALKTYLEQTVGGRYFPIRAPQDELEVR